MGFPLPQYSDGLSVPARKLVAACLQLSRRKAPNGVKTHSVIRDVWREDPARSPLDLYADILQLARDWVARYPLFETLGNFGSIDGDPPSGMRYNEVTCSRWAKLGPAFPHLLANGGFSHSGEIETDAPPGTDADPVYMEPLVSHVPLGSLRGGDLCSFLPPHNLKEISDALLLILDHPRATLTDVLQVLPGPDLPTGGILANPEDLQPLYRGGTGVLRVRARTSVETTSRGNAVIAITQVPYGKTKMPIVHAIAEHFHRLPDAGLLDVRDLSYQANLRMELELKKGQPPRAMIDFLQTRGILENSIEVRMVVSKDGQQTPVGLLDLLRSHLERRRFHLASDAKLRAELKSLAEVSDARRTTIASQ
jgi:DNA gyrase subunit A